MTKLQATELQATELPATELPPTDLKAMAAQIAAAARDASRSVSKATAGQRDRVLHCIARELREQMSQLLEANALDLSNADGNGMAAAMLDRLRLTDERIEAIARAVEEVVEMPDLVGRIERPETRPNGLEIARMRIPLGVVAIIYESRPNVTIDAAVLCLKSGNAAILRGGSEAFHSNQALGRALSAGLREAGLPETCVQVISTADRALIAELLTHDEEIDVVIPRGGEGLIRAVTAVSRVPVLKHYKGVCSVYVHAEADLEMALAICENGKAQRPGVCNSVETILIDEAVAESFVPRLAERFSELGIEMRGDERVCALANQAAGDRVSPAKASDWGQEYLALIVAIRIVPGFDEAVGHIERYGSNHTESIITDDQAVAERFLREVGSSTVMVNASTRFADGGELGLGSEIGISTTRLHAYGPMGAEGLTTTKFVVRGSGHIRT